MNQHVREQYLAGSGHNTAMFVLPGWLGWSKGQHERLLPVLSRSANVFGLDYVGPRFDAASVIREVAETVNASVHHGWVVHLFGTSLGGIVAAMAVAKLGDRLSPTQFEQIHITMVDSPSGADSLKQLPAWATQPVLRWLTDPPAWLDSRPVDYAFQRAFCGGMPEDAPIEFPADADKAWYRTDALEAAWRGQQGFKPRLALSELAFMTGVGGLSGGLARACNTLYNRGIAARTTYIACMGDNQVVRQPLARDFYARHLRVARMVNVRTFDHADYLQSAPSWQRVLSELF